MLTTTRTTTRNVLWIIKLGAQVQSTKFRAVVIPYSLNIILETTSLKWLFNIALQETVYLAIYDFPAYKFLLFIQPLKQY